MVWTKTKELKATQVMFLAMQRYVIEEGLSGLRQQRLGQKSAGTLFVADASSCNHTMMLVIPFCDGEMELLVCSSLSR
jgi:hypothetical protein